MSPAALEVAPGHVELVDLVADVEPPAAYVTRRMPAQSHALVIALYGGVTWVPRSVTS